MDGLPNDIVLSIAHFILASEQTNQSSLASLSSTSTRYRKLTIPALLASPHFQHTRSLSIFLSQVLPQHAHLVKSLFSLSFPSFNASKQVALDILEACKASLHTLSLDVPLSWKGSIAKSLKVGRWGTLRCLSLWGTRLNKWEKEEEKAVWTKLIQSVPHTVTSLAVESLSLNDLEVIAENVQWLEEFQFGVVGPEESDWGEDAVRGVVQFFMTQNPLLRRFCVVLYEGRVFGLVDWVVLDECVSRGIGLLKRGKCDEILSWDKLKHLPEAVSIQTVIQLFKLYMHFTSWELNLSSLNLHPLALHKRMEIYQLLVKEFGVKKLVIIMDEWSAEREVLLNLIMGCVPQNVCFLVVEHLILEDLGAIAESIGWLEEFQFQLASEEESDEAYIRDMAKFFLFKNPLLKCVCNVISDVDKVFSLIDWIMLDECVSRGISLKREGCDNVTLSWDKLKHLPESMSIQKVIQMLQQLYVHFTSWNFKLSFLKSLDPLSLYKNFEIYHLFVKVFDLKELTIKVDDWFSEICFQHLGYFLDKTGKNYKIQHLKFENFSLLSLSDNMGFRKLLMGCVGLKRISVDRVTLSVLNSCVLPPLAVSLHLSHSEISEDEMKILSTMSSLHFFISYSPSIEQICNMLNNWKSCNLPKTILIEVTDIKQTKKYLSRYLSKNLWFWKQDYKITFSCPQKSLSLQSDQLESFSQQVLKSLYLSD